MTVGVIIDTLKYIVVVLLIGGGIIEVVPIKISPLAWIGKRVNRDISEQVENIKKDFQDHKVSDQRGRILDFTNSCKNGRRHTQEEFNFIMGVCDDYEDYVDNNHIKNGQVKVATEYIRDLYRERIEKNDFLK